MSAPRAGGRAGEGLRRSPGMPHAMQQERERAESGGGAAPGNRAP
jgi:hypothetical protein